MSLIGCAHAYMNVQMEATKMSTLAEEKNYAKEQAKAQLESIEEMVRALDAGNTDEDAQEAIQEYALSVEIRSDWHTPGSKPGPEHYNILLCTGGPACRIIGELSDHWEPESARIEYQDWGTPWVEYRLNAREEKIVLRYASCFYFEG